MIPARGALLLLFLVSTVHAASAREGFALVLGGGGAKGFAHIGVMRALEELGATPSAVVGTSMGAILGSLYASGLDADAIESAVDGQDWQRVLFDGAGAASSIQGGWSTVPPAQLRLQLDAWPPRLPVGVSQGHVVEALVGRLTADALFEADQNFDALPIPFRAVATDLQSGEAVVFSHGPLPRLVRASGSLPFVFVPVEYEGRHYVDGGFVDNLPLKAARAMGFERALVVDVSNTYLPEAELPVDLFGLLQRAGQLAQRAENRIEASDDDVVLRVDLRGWNLIDFDASEDIVRAGYEAMLRRRDDVLALIDASGPAARRPRTQRAGPDSVRVERIEIRGARRMSGWSVRKRLGVAVGDEIELASLYARAEELSRQSIFETVWIDSRRLPDGGAHVIAHVVESDRPELEIAANYRDSIGPGALLRLRLDNRFGAGSGRTLSWRVSPESAALRLNTAVPIRGSRRVELHVDGGWIHERIDVERARDDTWSFRRGVFGVDVVVANRLDRPALRFGIEGADGRRSLTSGDPSGGAALGWRAIRIGLETWTGGGVGTWPARGVALRARYGIRALGGRSDAWSFEGGWVGIPLQRRWWGIHVALGGAWASSDLPVSLQGRAGGPRSWVGQEPDAIIAPRLVWTRLGFGLHVTRDIRFELAGALGWAGQKSLDEQPPRPGAQVSLIWDSALGPINLGWAGGREAEPRLVLDVGSSF